MTKRFTPYFFPLGLWVVLSMTCTCAHAEDQRSHGQLLYAPAYSEVPYGDKGINLTLTATLSIRNTDAKNAITVKRVDYFNSAGKLVRTYLQKPATLSPLAAVEYVVRQSDRSGGISASFWVEWESDVAVTPPYVEVLMVNFRYNEGMALNSPARVLAEKP